MWVGVCSTLWHHLVVKYAVFSESQSCSAEFGKKIIIVGMITIFIILALLFSLSEASHYWISKSPCQPGSQSSSIEWPLGFFSITLLIHASCSSLPHCQPSKDAVEPYWGLVDPGCHVLMLVSCPWWKYWPLTQNQAMINWFLTS